MWQDRKVRVPAGGQKRVAAGARRFFHLPPRNAREPLTIKVKFRGGAECWYEVHARGSVARYHGATAIHDVMREINQGGGRAS